MRELFGIRKELILALIFISGLFSPLLMIGLAIAVLIKYGEDSVIKQQCGKAIKTFIVFQIIFAVQDIVEDFVAMIWDDRSGFLKVNSKISYILLIAQICVYLWFAYRAYSGQSSSIYSVSSYPSMVSPAAAPSAANANPGARFCSKCGKEVNPDSKFCMGCGTPVE